MKIGILTLPLHTNYGGILQAWALQTVLEKEGHDVRIINLQGENAPSKFTLALVTIKRIILRLLGKKVNVNYLAELNYRYETVGRNTLNFISTHLKQIGLKAVKEGTFDVIIVGSDQVWRPLYNSFNTNLFFLDFAKEWNVKKVAYAASLGVDTWEYNNKQTELIANLLFGFDKITVREESGVNLLESKVGVKATCVLDPTLLLNIDDYVRMLDLHHINNFSKRLFCYILDINEEKYEISKLIEKQLSLKIASIMDDSVVENGLTIRPCIEKWLEYFLSSDFIFTDSFHGCVFSMIFNKPFAVFVNENRGSERFASLLAASNQEFRIVNSKSEFESRIDKLNTPPNVCFEQKKILSKKILSEL